MNTINQISQKIKENQLTERIYKYKPGLDDQTVAHQEYQKNLSYYLEAEVSKRLHASQLRIEYPTGKKFALCLTHDVDDITVPLIHKIRNNLYIIKDMNQGYIKKINEKYNYKTFKEIIEIEKKYEAKSTFMFLNTAEDIKRYRYNINDLKNELGTIKDEGFEVGLHGGYYSYNDKEKIIQEKNGIEKLLNQKIYGYRNHYLRFDIPNTWKHLSELGFKYDTTFCHSNVIGFRNETCHPFTPYIKEEGKYMDILEIPMNVMDTIYSEQRIIKNNFWPIFNKMMKTAEKYNGVITLNFHNNVFTSHYYQSIKNIYTKILQLGKEKNAWLTNGIDLYNFLNDDK